MGGPKMGGHGRPTMPDSVSSNPPASEAGPSDRVLLHLDGFEGPLDLLLDLARKQEVDLARISMLALVDQYVAAIEDLGMAATRLERAADWLVMAAWLTWLKSRLLLPQGSEEASEAERAAHVFTDRLARLERVRALAAWLEARPQLGRDAYVRGAPEAWADAVAPDLPALFQACLRGLRWQRDDAPTYAPRRPVLWGVQEALARLRALIGTLPDGSDLAAFFPPHLFPRPPPERPEATSTSAGSPADLRLRRRAAVASTLVGALELARDAQLRLRQAAAFGPIQVHAVSSTARAGPTQAVQAELAS